MAKELDVDTVAQEMFDAMSEHLQELKLLEAKPKVKELEVERWAQSFLKTCLGYSASSNYSISPQEQKSNQRPDLTIYQGDKVIFVVEVKKLGFNFNKSSFRSGKAQLSEYLKAAGNVPYGILCNGYEWRLYDFSDDEQGIEIFNIDLRSEDDSLDISAKFVRELCSDFVDLNEASYKAKKWTDLSKEVTIFAPESLTKALLSAEVIQLIEQQLHGAYKYKPCPEILSQRLFELLENGLDDQIKGYTDNSVKSDEFKKYIRSQLKIIRKAKQVSKQKSNKESVQAKVLQFPSPPDLPVLSAELPAIPEIPKDALKVA